VSHAAQAGDHLHHLAQRPHLLDLLELLQHVLQAERARLDLRGGRLGLLGGEFIASPTLAPASAETVQEIGYSDIFASTVNQTAADVEDEVGVITFRWYANNGSAGITNITPGLVRQLYASSEAPKWLFTGNPADTGTVYPIGRNDDSGTRGTAMAESGYGNVATVDQYTATLSGSVVTGIVPSGNAGYSSGSSVKNAMNATYSGGILIGYLGASDFASSGVELTWNGVPYSTANIQNGSYSFWGYLHMNRMNSLTGAALNFYNALKTDIINTPVDTGLLEINSMNVRCEFTNIAFDVLRCRSRGVFRRKRGGAGGAVGF
jgi:hypothetical protein